MDTLAFGATLRSGRFDTTAALLRNKSILPVMFLDMTSPLPRHQSITLQQDSG